MSCDFPFLAFLASTVASPTVTSSVEDYCVDLLPFSTHVTPHVPDPVIQAHDVPATSQSKVTASFQDNVSEDALFDQGMLITPLML
ncbi:hypothetical protein L1987_46562 [Smallanthus sonchifolius]|uniref:Uncharacterized protein n=1 Tax=Smallanthus sonchifolius TaxID=185202 RepID=A0ACB9G0Q6_9ASTR|nr:hypothetical protein L1987_46562 [Smallanthus sonchifolius]